jgi:SnoaL-like domain
MGNLGGSRSGSTMTAQPSSVAEPGRRLVAALADRDFPRLAEALAPDVRMRALLPPCLVEVSGAEAAAAKFSAWFGDAEELELIRSDSNPVADRIHVFYRLRVRKPDSSAKLVEQHLLCTCAGGRIDALDLVCTGFRPDDVAGTVDETMQSEAGHRERRAPSDA